MGTTGRFLDRENQEDIESDAKDITQEERRARLQEKSAWIRVNDIYDDN